MARRRPTQADVAQRAGVSPGTVSMVLNDRSGHVPISAETRRRVLQAMRELGYAPNPVAQMLARGDNNILGVFAYLREFPIEQQDFFYYYLLGIERGAQEHNYNLVLFTGSAAPGMRNIYFNGQNTLHLAAGAILLGAEPDRDELYRLAQEGYPFVYIGRREVSGYEIDWVTNDYAAGCREAVAYLIDLGHKSIGIIGLDLRLESHRDRLAGCRSAAEQAGDVRLVVLDESARPSGDHIVEVIRRGNLTALLCHDENTFETVMPALHDGGIRVPEDLSVVVLSTVDRAQNVVMNPTRVDFDRAAVGEAAVRLLVARLKGECEGPQRVLLPCTFVVGTTTAPPRRNATGAP